MNQEKTLYIIAGANGSGKTTFALSYTALNNLHFINADEIAKSYDPKDISKYKVKAGKEFFRQLQIKLDGENSFMIESTLSGKYLKDVIIKAKEKRFKDDNYEMLANENDIFVEYLYKKFLEDIV